MAVIVQWLVVIGVWWCALIDALAMYNEQDHYSGWLPGIWTCVIVLGLLHVAGFVRWRRERA